VSIDADYLALRVDERASGEARAKFEIETNVLVYPSAAARPPFATQAADDSGACYEVRATRAA
jgi:hypothetical protein